MKQPEQSAAINAMSERVVTGRNADVTAPARCLGYAIFSDLTSSPHDVEPVIARAEGLQTLEMTKGLPFEVPGFAALVEEMRGADADFLKGHYSGLFEVGSEGPPIPIREDLHRGQPAGLREDIVRFYDFFHYSLDENFAWAPDHLSVELEFMHYLCFQEAEGGGDRLSWQLAQLDFAERHLVSWVPSLADAVRQHRPDSIYERVTSGLERFVTGDFEWQAGTVNYAEGSE